MKRKILILTALIFLIVIAKSVATKQSQWGSSSAVADRNDMFIDTAYAEPLEDIDRSLHSVEAPVIPKPMLLPGPKAETQKSGPGLRQFILEKKLPDFIKGFLAFVVAGAVIVIMIGGIYFLISYGSEEKITQAKKIIQWSIIGLVVAIFSYAIVSIITRLPLPIS